MASFFLDPHEVRGSYAYRYYICHLSKRTLIVLLNFNSFFFQEAVEIVSDEKIRSELDWNGSV